MKKLLLYFVLLTTLISFSCSGLTDALTNISKLQWKLGNVNGMSLSGVDVSKFKNFSSITAFDLVKLTSAFTSGKLPASFTLNLLAKNPDNSGGSFQSSDVIRSLNWRLLIDNAETITGDISSPVTIPGVGQTSTIPIGISLDLLQFFSNKGMQNLVEMALGIGGANGSAARLSLRIKPTLDTFLGPITYPGEITVIDKEFRSK